MQASLIIHPDSKALIDDDFGFGDLRIIEHYDESRGLLGQAGLTIRFSRDEQIDELISILSLLRHARDMNRNDEQARAARRSEERGVSL